VDFVSLGVLCGWGVEVDLERRLQDVTRLEVEVEKVVHGKISLFLVLDLNDPSVSRFGTGRWKVLVSDIQHMKMRQIVFLAGKVGVQQ